MAVLIAATAAAQRGGRFADALRRPAPDTFDGGFNFCRIYFRSSRYGDGGDWQVDYPRGDINLSIRLSELTKTPVGFDRSGEPKHIVITLTEDELFRCPFVMMTEVGSAYFDEQEAQRLRTYLLKGGFLWADDFWGSYAWDYWENEIRKVLPSAEFPIVDLQTDHPLFRTLFEIPRTPQIPSIGRWGGIAGNTSERGADSAEVHTRAILDRDGRMMVLITHNTDFGDSWEREADDPRYFYEFSVNGYAVGINVVLYAMTH